MLAPPVPADEARRIAALLSCGVLDSAPDAAFDDIVQLASAFCGTPIALVSLVDRSRQWFKAKVGLTTSETPRDISFCAHAVVAREPLVVPDALQDWRFADNPLVTGEPFVRFYAGIPLVLAEGAVVGTLCVIDHAPRALSEGQLDALKLLARRASTELDLRRRLRATGNTPVPQELPSGGPTFVDGASGERALTEGGLPIGVGRVVCDRYRIERVLGTGGMGLVAAAHDLTTDTTVALKFMRAHALAEPQALQRFVREAQTLFALASEHVARVLDVGNLSDGAPFIVMEYLEGSDLSERLRREGRLPVREATALMLQACAAVEAAHAQGILHRDLKPANLFLTRAEDGSPRLKVLDFGISKAVGVDPSAADTALTGAASTLGSPQYMSPEQIRAPADVDVRSDIWSLGVVLFELLDGKPPFDGKSPAEVLARVLTGAIPSLRSARPDVPASVAAIVARCLERKPSRRYATVAELASALRAALALLPAQPAPERP